MDLNPGQKRCMPEKVKEIRILFHIIFQMQADAGHQPC